MAVVREFLIFCSQFHPGFSDMHRSSPTAFIAFIRDWRSVVEDTPIGQLLGNSQILDTQAPFWSGFPEPRSHNIYWRSEARVG